MVVVLQAIAVAADDVVLFLYNKDNVLCHPTSLVSTTYLLWAAVCRHMWARLPVLCVVFCRVIGVQDRSAV